MAAEALLFTLDYVLKRQHRYIANRLLTEDVKRTLTRAGSQYGEGVEVDDRELELVRGYLKSCVDLVSLALAKMSERVAELKAEEAQANTGLVLGSRARSAQRKKDKARQQRGEGWGGGGGRPLAPPPPPSPSPPLLLPLPFSSPPAPPHTRHQLQPPTQPPSSSNPQLQPPASLQCCSRRFQKPPSFSSSSSRNFSRRSTAPYSAMSCQRGLDGRSSGPSGGCT